MKLHVFHAADGDSLLVETDDAYLLVDGGRKDTFSRHTVPTLLGLVDKGKAIDALCVSHIDADHISGILRLFDDEITRRQHLYRHREDPDVATTGPYQPPSVTKLWHNGFEAQLGARSPAIADLLATTSTLLAMSTTPELVTEATFQRNLALSERQSAELSVQAAGVLRIPINPETDGKALVVEDQPTLTLGATATVKLLGPFRSDLTNLRERYVGWLEENSATVERLADDMRRDRERLANEIDRLVVPLQTAAGNLGDRNSVTVPNLASIMLYIEENGRSCVLTGDGHSDDVMKGLTHHGLLQPGSGLHVDILKIPHHGSEYNVDMERKGNYIRSDFLSRVTADHYVLCGNGAHDNPDLRVVKAIIDSRLGPSSIRSANPQTNDRFTLWFSTHPDRVDGDDASHLREVRRYVARRRRNRFDDRWLKDNSFVI